MKIDHWDQRNPPVYFTGTCNICGNKDRMFINQCVSCAFSWIDKVKATGYQQRTVIVSVKEYNRLKKEGYI